MAYVRRCLKSWPLSSSQHQEVDRQQQELRKRKLGEEEGGTYGWQGQQIEDALRRELAQREIKRHQLAEAELRRLAYPQKFRFYF
jgi:hypothetical protein